MFGNVVITHLRKPYPQTLNPFKVSITIGLFVSFFIALFQPFGLQYYQTEYKILILSGYGFVTTSILIINLFLLPRSFQKLFENETWTIFKQIVWLLFIIISIGIGNYFYSLLFSVFPWIGIQGFFLFIGFTIAIAIIPIIGLTILSYNLLLRKNLAVSIQLNEKLKIYNQVRSESDIIIYSKGNKQKIKMSCKELIFIESSSNYVTIWYERNEQLEHIILRNTLKNIENQIQDIQSLFKIHRAFIVNLNYIEKVNGNSQAYRLKLKNIDKEIPVSRNYIKELKNKISEY